VGGVYKIISKVLANKLKSVLGKIISSSHNAFIRGRQIMDLVLVAKILLARILGYRVYSLSTKYLGLSLATSYKTTSIWNSIIEKMERRPAGWKKLYLSKGGKLTLIKSTISNFYTYYVSFPYSSRGLRNFRGIFLWDGIGDGV
jgi:hypothetical protein